MASLDSGLIFERDSQWFGNNYRQTLEPRLFYYYSDAPSQKDTYNFDSNSLTFSYAQLFRDYQLAGEDYLDDSNQISTGVTTRFLDPKSGRELLHASLGQAYYLDERDVILETNEADTLYEQGRDHSALVAEAGVRINQFWDARAEHLWNDDKGSRERQTFGLRYRDDERRLFNLGYQFLDREPSEDSNGDVVERNVEQTYVSTAYPVSQQWSVIAHWNQDLTNSRLLESILGVEVTVVAGVPGCLHPVSGQSTATCEMMLTEATIPITVFSSKCISKGLVTWEIPRKGSLLMQDFGFEDRNKPLD